LQGQVRLLQQLFNPLTGNRSDRRSSSDGSRGGRGSDIEGTWKKIWLFKSVKTPYQMQSLICIFVEVRDRSRLGC